MLTPTNLVGPRLPRRARPDRIHKPVAPYFAAEAIMVRTTAQIRRLGENGD